ncbi:hypothetical protein OEB99_16685 [Actinotalea sp. M2MS4P-6]|uniref:hypothetical protein n=1 Tax=Actinotalea sp. M2MS4P-6 TaxID=2983762 RepID=UPI0021E4B5D2|nr:hypothetical protein [Actinotalea sp. M2MS4P-6]MCV2395954.1 hypothetical protein [Actinotalea sp. M2MS4P-6]
MGGALSKTFRLEFEGATWGELRTFLEAGLDAGVGDDEEIDLVWNDDDPNAGPEAFEITLVSKAKVKSDS